MNTFNHPRNFLVHIDTTRCTGCGWCVAACPLHLLSLETEDWQKHAVVNHVECCTGCKKCEVRCLFNAMHVVKSDSL